MFLCLEVFGAVIADSAVCVPDLCRICGGDDDTGRIY